MILRMMVRDKNKKSLQRTGGTTEHEFFIPRLLCGARYLHAVHYITEQSMSSLADIANLDV